MGNILELIYSHVFAFFFFFPWYYSIHQGRKYVLRTTVACIWNVVDMDQVHLPKPLHLLNQGDSLLMG